MRSISPNLECGGRSRRSSERSLRRPHSRSAIALFSAAILFALTCGGRETAIENGPIIVISIDTLRSDRLPAYGYTRVATPGIDSLRSDSILFERAYSQCPLTLVSHASMFTGLLPSEHGVHDNIGYSLNPKVKTVAELLKTKGYATGAAVSAIVLRGETGMKRGFDFYDDIVDIDPGALSMGRAQRSGDETRKTAEQWLKSQTANPFFFFLHIYEPHTPHDPSPEFRSRYGRTYDAEVATADAIVGRFLSFLREEKIYDRATIILLSDHGEGLGDHGEEEHGVFLYREAIQVPLILKLPGNKDAGKSVSTPVGLVDVFPTLWSAAAPGGAFSLTKIADGEKPDRVIYSETFYPRFHFGWNELHSAIVGDDHFIRAPKPELYDLGRDPGEKRNVLEENRRAYAALRTRIEPFVKAAAAPQAIDSEHAQQLAALGYIGSAASTSPDEKLPDPKDRIGSVNEIKVALAAFEDKKYEDAVSRFGALLRGNPRMIDVWSMQSRALTKLGRREEAIEAAKAGLRVAPTATNLAVTVANLSVELNRLDDAEGHARLALKDVPSQAHYILAQVARKRGDYTTAAKEAGLAATEKRDRPLALMLLGEIALDQNKPDEALRSFTQAAELIGGRGHSSVAKLHFFTGDALARLGRGAEAEKQFLKEIELFPADAAAYKNLILIYAIEGRNDAATKLIFDLEKAAPLPPSYLAIAEALKAIGDARGARYWAARGLQRFPGDRSLQTFARSL
jgi:arylsulfatase A-like enzyme/Tfp pilus assembly protein PilF